MAEDCVTYQQHQSGALKRALTGRERDFGFLGAGNTLHPSGRFPAPVIPNSEFRIPN